jgi:hypothetical protein
VKRAERPRNSPKGPLIRWIPGTFFPQFRPPCKGASFASLVIYVLTAFLLILNLRLLALLEA